MQLYINVAIYYNLDHLMVFQYKIDRDHYNRFNYILIIYILVV